MAGFPSRVCSRIQASAVYSATEHSARDQLGDFDDGNGVVELSRGAVSQHIAHLESSSSPRSVVSTRPPLFIFLIVSEELHENIRLLDDQMFRLKALYSTSFFMPSLRTCTTIEPQSEYSSHQITRQIVHAVIFRIRNTPYPSTLYVQNPTTLQVSCQPHDAPLRVRSLDGTDTSRTTKTRYPRQFLQRRLGPYAACLLCRCWKPNVR